MEYCPHIKFEICSGELSFRGKSFVMASAGVADLEVFDIVATPAPNRGLLVRRMNDMFEYNGNLSWLKKSDYGRTKLFVGGNRGLTLYIAMSDNFYEDDKVVFTMESQYSLTVQNAIHKFNYNLCKNCSDKECNKVLVSDEAAASIMLPDDLFSL